MSKLAIRPVLDSPQEKQHNEAFSFDSNPIRSPQSDYMGMVGMWFYFGSALARALMQLPSDTFNCWWMLRNPYLTRLP